jgi:SAM-dependent methyltransferase
MKTLLYFLNVGNNTDFVEKAIWSLKRIGKYTGDICVLSDHKKLENTVSIADYILKNFGKPHIDRYQIFQLKYIIDEVTDISQYDCVIYCDSDILFKDDFYKILEYVEKSSQPIVAQENIFGSFRSHVGATDYFKVVKPKYDYLIDQMDGQKHLCAGFFCVKKSHYNFFKTMRNIFNETNKQIDDQSAFNIIYKTVYPNDFNIFPRYLAYFNDANSAPVQHCCDKGAFHRFFNPQPKYCEFVPPVPAQTVIQDGIYAKCIEHPHLGGNVYNGPDVSGICPKLWEFFKKDLNIKSILDVGCGEGYAAKHLKDMGFEVFGIDGLDHNIVKTLEKGVDAKCHDLVNSAYIHDKHLDMIWCCEVVEHIEEKYIKNLMRTLCQFDYVAMTHAEPGQLGYHHVNCKERSYWISLLEEYGFKEVIVDPVHVDSDTWFAQHGILAKRRSV